MTEKNINKWLKEGEQSKITPRIKEIIIKFNGDEIEKIIQILNWSEKNIKREENYKKVIKIFAKRNIDKIIKDKYHTGCHDTALIVAVFLRKLNIPTKYLTGIDKLNPKNRGHCVVEAYIKNRWILIDPSKQEISLNPKKSDFYEKNYIIGVGLDSWDNNIKSFKDWKRASERIIKHLPKI